MEKENQMLKKMLPDRFMAKVDIQPDGCWLWTANTTNGYGRFSMDHRAVRAHRFSYQQIIGAIPEDLEIDHLCRKKSCCNPIHLEAVTHKENMRRAGLAGVGKRNRDKTHCPQGHPYDDENTYHRPGGGRHCQKCQRARTRKRKTMSLKDK